MFFFFQAEDGIRDLTVTGVQTCALPIFYSCTMLAIEARGADIKTAESLGGDKLDAVPTAFVDHDAQQCGFCTPGFVVSIRSEERRVGKSVDLGGRRIIKKKK